MIYISRKEVVKSLIFVVAITTLSYFIHDFIRLNKCNKMTVRQVSYEHCYEAVDKCFLTGRDWEELYMAQAYRKNYCRED